MDLKTKKTVLMALFLFFASPAMAGSVTMRVVFENPSELEEKKDIFKTYLPSEIRKEDVLETGGLKLDYDPGRSQFYVYTEASLKPKESKTYKLVMENVWKIPDDEINFVKVQAEERYKALEGSPDYNNAKALYEKIFAVLNEIQSAQNNPEKDAMKTIENYRLNKQRLKYIRDRIILVKDFKQEAEIDADSVQYPRQIKYVINIKNASASETRTQMVVNYLPEGIRPEYILDFQGFEVKFDEEKKLYYLTQKVELKPGEAKKFQILVSDRWTVPKAKLDVYLEKAESLADFLKDTGFKDASSYLLNDIKRYIQEILDSQSKDMTIKDRIANYFENIKKVEAIKIDLAELERMAEVESERMKKKQVEDLLKRLAPDELMTWKIIYSTITFLAVISFATYILWWGQTKSKLSRDFKDISGGQEEKKS